MRKITPTQARKDQAASFATQLGLDPDELYEGAVAAWSNLNPQSVLFSHALSVAGVTLRAAQEVRVKRRVGVAAFVDAYREWTTDRIKLSAQEDEGEADADEWAASDDTAVVLVKLAAVTLANGHCLDCGNALSEPITEADLLAGTVPEGTYGDAGNGFCQVCDFGRKWSAEDRVNDA